MFMHSSDSALTIAKKQGSSLKLVQNEEMPELNLCLVHIMLIITLQKKQRIFWNCLLLSSMLLQSMNLGSFMNREQVLKKIWNRRTDCSRRLQLCFIKEKTRKMQKWQGL